MTGEAFGQAACQAYLGYIYESADDRALAAECLSKACAGFAEVGVEPDKFEAQVVAPRVALVQAQPNVARELTTEVWKYLCEQGTEGLGSPTWVYACIADVLDAIKIPEISLSEVIEAGYHDLMQRAKRSAIPNGVDRFWKMSPKTGRLWSAGKRSITSIF